MRILALDVGTKRIGLALSDMLMITAQGLDSLYRKDLAADLEAIRKIVEANGVSEIVAGLPLNMDGTYSAKTRETVGFIEELAKAIPGVPVKTWDERLTSRQAERIMIAGDVRRHERKLLSDRIAAQLILQSYMSTIKPKE